MKVPEGIYGNLLHRPEALMENKSSRVAKRQGGWAGYSCPERREGNQCLGRLG